MAKVLLVHPDFSRLGGIESYFLKIKPHLQIDHESCGNSQRPGESGLFARMNRILGDFLVYWKRVSRPEISVVHLNPSLQPRMFYRDFIYLWIAKFHGKKTVVFFHGWDTRFQQKIDSGQGRMFRFLYGRADAFIVLAAAFTETLRNWGITQPVHQEVIVIEDEIFNKIDLEEILQQRRRAKIKLLLFPSRLIRAKGILTAINALAQAQKHNPDIGLVVAGDGEDANEARNLVQSLGLEHTEFTGLVSGEQKYELFRRAHLLCFPSEHPEGFPNTIVEAMAFGLPVITRPAGGIRDFFINETHGFITDSVIPGDFAQLIERALGNDKHYLDIARANHRYAGENFLASQAAARLQQIYRSL